MSNPYVLPGLAVADMMDRSQIFKAICSDLGEKATPDHVSIVGPKYFGKTVLLNKIASYFREPGSPYQIVCYWDLRHGTPENNLDFQTKLARKLDEGLLAIGINEYHDYPVLRGKPSYRIVDDGGQIRVQKSGGTTWRYDKSFPGTELEELVREISGKA